jgi:hypothetical protein
MTGLALPDLHQMSGTPPRAWLIGNIMGIILVVAGRLHDGAGHFHGRSRRPAIVGGPGLLDGAGKKSSPPTLLEVLPVSCHDYCARQDRGSAHSSG